MSLKTRRIGVIDIGSNSVRLVIFEVFGVAATPVFNEKIHAGLGRDLAKTGRLYAEGAAQTLKALHRYKALSESQNLDELRAVATAAMREAEDGPAFVKQVKDEIGIKIQVLTGAQEGHFSALGVVTGDRRSRGVVADLGGSSLELIRLDDMTPGLGQTFKLGPLAVMTNGYHPAKLRKYIRQTLRESAHDFHIGEDTLYLVGGAWRNLAQIHNERVSYPLQILQNFSMRPQEALALGKWAGEEANEDLLNWPGVSRARAETLPYSGLVMGELIKLLKPSNVVFSSAGLREGSLYNSLTASTRKRVPLMDACRHLAQGNEQGQDFGPSLFRFLKPVAPFVPRAFDEEAEMRLREAACLLVGIGKGLHPDHRANLVFSDVLYAPLAGLTHRERAYLAQMLYTSFTMKGETPNEAALNYHLMNRERQAARTWGAAMRFGSVISARSADLLKAFKLTADEGRVELKVKKPSEALLNRKGVLRFENFASLAGLSAKHNWVDAMGQDYWDSDND